MLVPCGRIPKQEAPPLSLSEIKFEHTDGVIRRRCSGEAALTNSSHLRTTTKLPLMGFSAIEPAKIQFACPHAVNFGRHNLNLFRVQRSKP
jgi:hypothetical protein